MGIVLSSLYIVIILGVFYCDNEEDESIIQ